ncbi:3-oxoacyl-[acyl-carrier-protein] synthase-3 [Bacilli bacterium PM5-3]|nr:3-oxoacyl-[acyl-carrier-protein] synthase-3 [Bacilli bacterium PM5-3]
MKARIVSTGCYYPDVVVNNQDLEKIMDTNDEWIVQRTGIKERRFSNHNTAYMAYLSALNALENSTIKKEDIDLVIVATFTPDNLSPSCANEVVKLLDIKGDIPSFDINAACSGFIYGLKVVQAFIESGMYKTVLLIGSENISKVLDFNDRGSAILFGDGAGAAIIQANDIGIIDTIIANKTDTKDAIVAPNGIKIETPFTKNEYYELPYVQMKGQEVFKFATTVFVKSLKEIVKANNLTFEDIKYIVPHQANLRIIEYAIKVLKIDKEKFVINLDKVGNTSAASVPIALDDLRRQGQLEKGDKIILVAFGSGLTYGVSLLEW